MPSLISDVYLKDEHPQSRGFTLVEVVVAASVMLAGIVGMMHVITSGSEMLDASRKQTIATQIMHGEIERIRVTNWEKIAALAVDPTTPKTGSAKVAGQRLVSWEGDPNFNFNDAFRFTREFTSPKSGMKQVTYSVSWVGNTGKVYNRSASTYIGKNGLYVAYQR